MATKKKVILEGEIKTTIANAQEVTSKIQAFKKQLDALEMPKEATKAFEKAFDKVLKGLDEFEIKAGRGVSSLADTKELERAWKAIVKNIDGLEVALRGLNAGDIFPKEVKNNIESAQKALDKYVKKLAEAKQSEAYKNKTKSKNDLIESKGNYEKELKNAKQKAAREEGKYEAQRKKWGETEQKQYEAQVKALEDKTKARDEYLKTQKKAEKEALRDALQKQKYITEDPKARGRYRLNLTTARTIAGKEDGEEKEAARKKLEEAENVLGQLAAIYDKEKTMNEEIADASEIVKGLKEQKDALDDAEKSWKDAQDSVEIYTKKIEDTESAIKQVDSELETMSLDEAKKEWEAVVKVFQDLLGIDLSGIAQDAELVQKQLTQYQTDEVKKLPNIYELLKKALGAVGPAAKQAGEGIEGLNAEAKELSEAEKDIDNLKRQLLDFFSISNAIELFKRAIRSAVDTVKELDTVMTETAVVTDFSIGDMWDKLPDYADKASDLGTSIAELYSATTLYYQQGLKTEQAMGVGVETMKMARIAAMDAEDATTAMTAALRGFNMEVNEMNAQRVSDVYSELAAISAADTNQIATAMGKTASIAASANMEFETTAAFLTQIIETTQEAPETAGTALKTIVARFTEVKELFSEGMLTGEDSEGEEININKIDEALRTVGISLKDFLNGSKGMDDIFLELASKWDSLDLATQRYIATAAAGSRQQSRFIAMMSNYGRTMELVDAANNSAGASQEQYAKTLESLDTKLQQLKNAWDTFAMGLANDETIKVAVDALTWILEKINLIIEAISGGNGMTKSLVSLGAAFGVLKTGGTAFEALFATVAKAASKEGLGAGNTFVSAFKGALKEKSGKLGENFKDLFSWKKLAGSGKLKKQLELGDIKLSDFSDYSKGQISKSILEQYDAIIKGQEKINSENIKIAKTNFQKAFDTGNAKGAIDELNKSLEGTGKEIDTTKISAIEAGDKMAASFGAAAAAVAGLSVALAFVTNKLEEGGHERGAEGFEALAGGASILAGILIILPGLLKGLGVAASAAGPIGWAIAAITGLISLCVALEKWIENDTEKLERLNEEAREAADAAKETKEAYESLLSDETSYNALQKELEDLTKGTDEWKQKLIEVNNQVLQLLETYPELAGFIQRGSEGQLTISEQGWKNLIDSQQEGAKNAQLASLVSSLAAKEQDNYLNKKELAKQLRGVSPYLHEERVDKVVEWYNTGINANHLFYDYTNTDRWRFADSIGLQDDVLYENREEIAKYAEQLKEEQVQRENRVAATLMSSVDLSSDQGEKYGNMLIGGFSKSTGLNLEQQIEQIADKKYGNKSRKKLRDMYHVATGLNADETWSADLLARKLAEIDVGKKWAQDFENTLSKFELIENKDLADKYARYLSLDAGTITKAMTTAAIDSKSLLAAFGFTEQNQEGLAEFAQNYGIDIADKSWDEIVNAFNDKISGVVATAGDEIESTAASLKELLGVDYINNNNNNNKVLDNASNDQIQAYAELLKKFYGGADGGFLRIQLDKILSQAQSQGKYTEVMDYLSAMDVRGEGAADNFIEYLKETGIVLKNVPIEQFTTDLKKLSDGFKRIDLEKIISETKDLYDLAEDFKDRKGSEGITEKEYELLSKAEGFKEEDFFWTGQEWQYIGGSMEELALALEKNTNAILTEKQQEVQDQIDRAKDFEKRIEKNGDFNSGNYSKEQVLSGKMTDVGTIKSLLGLENANYTNAQIMTMYEEMVFAYNRLATNEDTASEWASMSDQASRVHTTADVLAAKGDNEALQTLANTYDVTAEKIAAYQKALEASGVSAEKAKTIALSVTTVLAKQQKIADDSVESWQEYLEKLDNLSGAEYDAALGELALSLNRIFNSDLGIEDLNEKFLSLLKEWIEGSAEAGKKVQKLIGQDMVKEMGSKSREAFSELEKQIEAMDQSKFEIGGAINLDVSGLLANLALAEKDALDVLNAIQAVRGVRLQLKDLGNGLFGFENVGTVVDTLIPATDSSKNSDGGSSSKWENPYDKLYNVVQRINTELRLRERLEREYQRLLNNSVLSSSELAKNSREQIASLEYEKKTREYLLEKRREEMALLGSEFSDVAHYASWDENVGVMLNQEALAKLDGSTNEELTSKVEKYISKMEEKADQIYEEADAIDEIEDTVKEIQEQGKDEYIDFESQVKDALIFEREQEIEKLTEINETINDSNSKLINAMQESINKERQARENSKTEEELEEKRQRLAQLQMDTSGANALEILALEKEIADQEQGFIDTLVDQKIQALQDQNEKAYEQRQHQIEILQWQKEFWEKNGDIWEDVQKAVREGYDPEKGIINGSTLQKILQNEANFKGLSAIGQQEWWKDLTETLTAAFGYLEVNQQLEHIGATAGEKIKFKYGSKEFSGTINKDGSVTTDDGRVFNNVYKGFGGYYAGENINETQKNIVDEPIYKSSKNKENNTGYDNDGRSKEEIRDIQKKLKALGYAVGEIDGLYGSKTRSAVIDFKKSRQMSATDKITDSFLEKLSYSYKLLFMHKGQDGGSKYSMVALQAYASGGLADFTGPAWLDGTKAKPEYILDAAQTERFFALVDILDSWKGMDKTKDIQNSGDNIVDIDINIETVKEEADVDMLAEKVQRAIVTSAQYRNNNFVQR